MNALHRWLAKRSVDRDLDEEMSAHREEEIDALVEGGMDEAEARATVGRRFGNVTLLKDDSRDAWGWVHTEQMVRDVRYNCRVLRRDRGFAATVVLILALGIGMNTAVFSLIKGALLSRLPYPRPEQLAQLWQVNTSGTLINVSGPDLRDWRKQSHEFASLASFDMAESPLAGTGFTPRRIHIGVVGAGFFETVGVQAMVGHVFTPKEQRPGGAPAVLLASGLAAQLFGSDIKAIGKSVRVQGLSFVVTGVMPPSFDFPAHAQVWLPNDFFGDDSSRSAHNFHVIGRIRNGRSLRQAREEMNVIADRLGRTYIDDKDYGIRVASLYEALTAPVRSALLLLFAAVSLVLLLACVNISSLQLTRTTLRLREFAFRAAVGAARSRLIAQLLTESMLLATAGAVLGLFVAAGGTRLLKVLAPSNLSLLVAMRIDTGMLAFTVLLAFGTAVAFGLLPAFVGSQVKLSELLKEGQTQSSAAPSRMRWARVLIIGQITVTVVLLACASLVGRSYWKLSHVPTGLQSEEVMMGEISWPTADGNSANASEVKRISRAVLRRLKANRQIEAAAFIHPLPVLQPGPDGNFEIEGRASSPDPHKAFNALYRLATPDYFRVFGIPVLRGRLFTEKDEESGPLIAVVNHSFATKFFPNSDVIGQKIRFFGFDRMPQFLTVVGVVPDVRTQGLDAPFYPEVFASLAQHGDSILDASLIFRGKPTAVPFATETVRKLSPETPIRFERMTDLIVGTIARERFETLLLSLFGGFALLLAGVGIFGLLSFSVSQRINELGIRMALGAARSDVLTLIMSEGSRLIGIGLLLGTVAALLATRLVSGFLYAVEVYDPFAFIGAILCLLLAALAGCYLPALRASRIEAISAIRHT